MPAAELKAYADHVEHTLRYEDDHLASAPSFLPVELVLPASTVDRLTADVLMPSKKVDVALIHDNRDGSVTVKYLPKEPGLHELQIKHNGELIQGNEFSLIFAFEESKRNDTFFRKPAPVLRALC